MLKSFYLHGPIFDFLPEGVIPIYDISKDAVCYKLENSPEDGVINFSKAKAVVDEVGNIRYAHIPIFYLNDFEFTHDENIGGLSESGRKSLTRFADIFVNQINASTGGNLKNKKISVVLPLVDHRKYKLDGSPEFSKRKKEFYSGKGLGVGLMLISEPISPTNEIVEDLCLKPRTLEDL